LSVNFHEIFGGDKDDKSAVAVNGLS